MPFVIRKIRNEDAYSVKNSETGRVHSKHTTKKHAKAQVRLLENLGGMGNKASQLRKEREQEISLIAQQTYAANIARELETAERARLKQAETRKTAFNKKKTVLESNLARNRTRRDDRDAAEQEDRRNQSISIPQVFPDEAVPAISNRMDHSRYFAGPPMSHPSRPFNSAEFVLQPKTELKQPPDAIHQRRKETYLMGQEDKASKQLSGSGVRKVRGQESYSFVHKGNVYAHPSRRQAKKHLKLLGGMQVPDDDEQDEDEEDEDRVEVDLQERVRDYLEAIVPEDMIETIIRAIYENDEVDELHALSDEDLHAHLDTILGTEETIARNIISDKLNTLGIGRQNTGPLIEFLTNEIGLSIYAISTLRDRAIRRYYDEMMRDSTRKYTGGLLPTQFHPTTRFFVQFLKDTQPMLVDRVERVDDDGGDPIDEESINFFRNLTRAMFTADELRLPEIISIFKIKGDLERAYDEFIAYSGMPVN